MAEGEGRIRSRSASEHSLQSLDTHSTTKQEAIDHLQYIIRSNEHADEELDENAKKLLKCLSDSEKKPDDLLTSPERSDFIKVVKSFKTLHKGVVEVTRLLEVWQGIRTLAHKNDPSHLAIITLEEQLTSTKARLKEAQERIEVLDQELTQIRSKQSSERIMFEKELASMREEKMRQRSLFEEEIRTLKITINKLEEDKRALERQINELRDKIQEEKAINEKYKQEQKELLETVSQTNIREIGILRKEQDDKLEEVNKTHSREMQKLKTDVHQLMEDNRKLKTRDPYKLVGYGVTLITNALYKHVHKIAQLRKNYYSINDLESHLENNYQGNEERRQEAQDRWDAIKRTIGWTGNARALINQLAENREKGTRHDNINLTYGDFSEVVKVMFNQNEIDQREMHLIKDLFAKCSEVLPMQAASRN